MKFGTKSILVKDGKILLIKRSNYDGHRSGEWDLPGGRIEEGEKVFGGHKREVMEETGLKIDIVEPVRCWSAERLGEKHVGITFLSKFLEGEIVLSNEHTEYKWMSPDESQEMEIEEWMKKEVKLAEELNPKLFTKDL